MLNDSVLEVPENTFIINQLMTSAVSFFVLLQCNSFGSIHRNRKSSTYLFYHETKNYFSET